MDNQHKATMQHTLAEELSQAKENFRKVNGDQKAQMFSDFVDKLSQSNIEANALKVGLQARKANNNMDQGISGSK